MPNDQLACYTTLTSMIETGSKHSCSSSSRTLQKRVVGIVASGESVERASRLRRRCSKVGRRRDVDIFQPLGLRGCSCSPLMRLLIWFTLIASMAARHDVPLNEPHTPSILLAKAPSSSTNNVCYHLVTRMSDHEDKHGLEIVPTGRPSRNTQCDAH